MVREISTIALSTEAAIRFAQSWELFCRRSTIGAVGAVMRASWVDLDWAECSGGCGCDIGENCMWMRLRDIHTVSRVFGKPSKPTYCIGWTIRNKR